MLTVYFDNQNAVTVCSKGSNKPRLQKFAKAIHNLCEKFSVQMNPVWIPRDLNNFADMLSKTVDYEDYYVTQEFFELVCNDFDLTPAIDCFANNNNSKTTSFFSLTYCPRTVGIDAFQHNWKNYGPAWLFPPPRLLLRTLRHLQNCQGEGIILLPQWKNNFFYPAYRLASSSPGFVKRVIYEGAGIFRHGADIHSHFGPSYCGNVELIHLRYSDC